jgi:DNA repair protein RecO (recombination protein O)
MTLRDRVLMLRRVEYGDSDLIVTLLAREGGKISARARGARRSRRRFGAALGWFVISDAELTRRGSAELHTLLVADVREAFVDLAADPVALSHASYATELVRELVAAEQPEPAVFDLLVDLYRVARARPGREALRSFELALLGRLGMAPDFERCSRCGTADEGDLARGALLEPEGGGVVCSGCASQIRGLGARPLSDGARRALVDAALAPDLAAAAATEPLEAEIATEAREATQSILSRHLSRPLRSLEFIAKMNR